MVGTASYAEGVFAEFLDSVAASSGLASDSFYTRLRDVVLPRMLARFVTGETILTKQSTTANPDNVLKPVTISETDYPLTAVSFGYPSDKIDGVLIKNGDLRVLFGAGELTNVKPVAGDRVRLDGTQYTIKNVRAVPAIGIVVLYELQVALQSKA